MKRKYWFDKFEKVLFEGSDYHDDLEILLSQKNIQSFHKKLLEIFTKVYPNHPVKDEKLLKRKYQKLKIFRKRYQNSQNQ